MVKKRRVGTRSYCAAVAPLCCRKGQMKVNKCVRTTQISFTIPLFARLFHNQFFFSIVNAIGTLFCFGVCVCLFVCARARASTIATMYNRLLPCPQLSERMSNIKVDVISFENALSRTSFISRRYKCDFWEHLAREPSSANHLWGCWSAGSLLSLVRLTELSPLLLYPW